MMCGGCTQKVMQALNNIAGFEGVNVSLAAGEATVQYDEETTSTDELKAAVKGAGYNADSTERLALIDPKLAAAALVSKSF